MQLESELQQDELQQKSCHSELVHNLDTNSHQQQEIVEAVPISGANVQKYAEMQHALPKIIIKPWEELVHNKHRTGLGYDKELSFHIPD